MTCANPCGASRPPSRPLTQLSGENVTAAGGPAWYEIRVVGVLDSRWAGWFDGLELNGQGEETVIFGMVSDQPALHGLLIRIRDLGLILISVRRLGPHGRKDARPEHQ